MEVGNWFQMILNNLKPNKGQIKNNLLWLTREKKTLVGQLGKNVQCIFSDNYFFLAHGKKGLFLFSLSPVFPS